MNIAANDIGVITKNVSRKEACPKTFPFLYRFSNFPVFTLNRDKELVLELYRKQHKRNQFSVVRDIY
jgi:hypothetical protein